MKGKNISRFLFILMCTLLSLGFVSCGSDDDNEDEPSLKFTKSIIAGDFSWYVDNYTIERGASKKIAKGIYIHFNNDGSCKCFHSMETAYRINNGKIETYYAKSGEPMFIYSLMSQRGDILTVRMEGTLDDDLLATLTLKKSSE